MNTTETQSPGSLHPVVRRHGVKCSCGDEYERDHSEFGLPLGYNRVCAKCWQMWMSPNHKLTQSKVDLIRNLSSAGLSQAKIAKKFGICQMSVSLIVRGKLWTTNKPNSGTEPSQPVQQTVASHESGRTHE